MIQTVVGTVGSLNETITQLGIKAVGINDSTPLLINVTYLSPLQLIIMSFSVFVVALVFHEIGHYMYAKKYDKDAKIIFKTEGWKLQLGTEYSDSLLNGLQEKRMLVLGIVFGTLPIWAASAAHMSMFVLIGPYFVGCYKDFVELMKKDE
jgi:hypothetical protein